MVPGQGAFSGLGLGDGNPGGVGESRQRCFGPAVEHPAAGDDQGRARRLEQARKFGDLMRIRLRRPYAPVTRLEEGFGVVEGFGLDVLAEA